MEKFGRFELGFERPRTPEERFRELARHEAERIRWETLDPLAKEIAEKILFKLDLKDRLADIDRYKDDVSRYQDLKRLGIFLVFDRIAQHEWKDEESDFFLGKGDRYLDLHLPPLGLRERKTLLAQTKSSLELIARYIQKQQLNPKYVLGVTYEKLASVSRRFGFKIIEPPVPEDIRRGVENVYRDFVKIDQKGKKPIGKILVCYQGLTDFIDRYSNPESKI